MTNPVFYDPTGRRRLISFAGVIALIVLAAALFCALVYSIIFLPTPQELDLHMALPQRQAWTLAFHKPLPKKPQIQVRAGKGQVRQLVAGFYVPWDDSSRESLEQHMGQMDVVVTALATLTGPEHSLNYTADERIDSLLQSATKRPAEFVMIQNAVGDDWQGKDTAAMMADPAARQKFFAEVGRMLKSKNAAGVTFDFEDMPPGALKTYQAFIQMARAALPGFQVTITAPVDEANWDLKAFANVSDRVFLMVYDQHSSSDDPGPIAAQKWFNRRLGQALKKMPANKAIVCFGNYAYDWHGGHADDLSVQEAWLIAHDSEAPIDFDKASGNAVFYYEEDGTRHQVWMLDAVSAWNQLRTAAATNAAGVALWRLGGEDPVVWNAIRDYQGAGTPDLTRLSPVGNVDVEGVGEIINIGATPKFGDRQVMFDANRVAQDEVFGTLPTPYVIRRAGHQPGKIALTFDDGPDPQWTPQILKILKAENIKATFFVTGEKAIGQPGLLRRMVREGHDIGNHTYSHPDLSHTSPDWVRVELNSTQRIVQAYTGRSMRLFRAPFFGDAEPTTDNEIEPALLAQKMGYTNVGLHVDSEDWQRPGVNAIIKNVMDGVHSDDADYSGQVVLMHDAGGERSETIAALPQVIHKLRAEGYSFVTVGGLVGLSADQVMPPLTGHDLTQVRTDFAAFMSAAVFLSFIKWLFIVAIVLGIGRALILAGLAIVAEYRGQGEPPAEGDDAFVGATSVSVVIPAFNEAKVIVASIRRVLESQGVAPEIIVVDDGSRDDTAAIVREAFATEPRVHLISQPNQGKARAVNAGIRAASGDIIITLDADTHFEAETIARLVRWFVRPDIGAVAGNAKVGNRFNWVTRWQAVEYVTSQNLERSAMAMLGAIMVVPGAVGAWRRGALDAVGGYPEDTLAEDQDLTIAVQRAGWKVAYDPQAVAWTEAPESLKSLRKQRYRWAFGTLQCLWKHRRIVTSGRPRGLAMIGIPQAWLFQIAFSLVSPIIDLALVANIIGTVVRVHQHGWAQSHGDLLKMLVYWFAFLTIDALCGAIAYWLEPREKRYPVISLLSQRFVYRQIMYYVVIKAVMSAWHGLSVGWGKLERTGRIGTGVPTRPEDIPAE